MVQVSAEAQLDTAVQLVQTRLVEKVHKVDSYCPLVQAAAHAVQVIVPPVEKVVPEQGVHVELAVEVPAL